MSSHPSYLHIKNSQNPAALTKLDIDVVSTDAFVLIIDSKVYDPILAGHLDCIAEFLIDLSQRVGPCWKRFKADVACPADLT
jgi:hypothetical protein